LAAVEHLSPTRIDAVIDGIGPDLFRDVFRHWPSGVAIATSLDGDRAHGMIVGSFTSVALDPPQVMFSADTQSRLHDIIVRNGCFAISILAAHQTELLARFGGIDRSHDTNRFAGITTETHITGCPVLPESVAWVDCRMADLHRGEGFTIFIGTIVAASLGAFSDDSPMVYYRRAAHGLG
jgi:flavin reductase (DIM6/NTAB) family NADH-FMN oxidoreductase RutF